MKNIYILIIAFSVVSLAGCKRKIPPADADLQAFQKYYSDTKWYFVERQFNPEKIENVTIQLSNSIQFILEFPSGTNIIYTEFEPKKMLTIKSFIGNGTLSVIHDVNKPIFQVTSDYTKHNDCIILNGFVGSKRFQIEAKSSYNNENIVLRDAVALANIIYNYYDKNNQPNH